MTSEPRETAMTTAELPLSATERRMLSRYAGRCWQCGGDVPANSLIAWDGPTKTIRHLVASACNGQRITRPAQANRTAAGRICTNCGGRVPANADHGLCNNCG